MSRKKVKEEADSWWLDRTIAALVGPLLRFFPDRQEKSPKKPTRVIKVLYGSSEPCYCGSGEKYKHCCKKVNKREDKIAYKIITNTRKGQREKVKVVRSRKVQRLFQNHFDSGMDPIQFD